MDTATRVLSLDIGIKNMCFCITDFRDDEFELVHVEKFAIGTVKQTCHQLTFALIDSLRASEAINDKQIDYIFIEQQMQISTKNTVLAYAAVSYFYTESIFAQSDVHIQFVPPRVKFKAIEAYFPGVVESQDMICKTASKDLKKLSIKIARDVFTELNVERGLEAMHTYRPKLDDVADVFLQSFAVYLDKYRGNKSVAGNPLRSRKKRKR